MEFEEIAKKYKNFYAPNYQILVDGEDILRKHLEITNVTVDDTLEMASGFEFSLNDPGGKLLDSELFDPGKEVEIKMGYVNNLATMTVGEITRVRPTFPRDGTLQLTIGGSDLSTKIRMVRTGYTHENKRVSEVVAEIAASNPKLKTEIETTEPELPSVVQPLRCEGKICTDYLFIKMLADKSKSKFEFFIKERTLYFRPKRDKSAIVTLKYGTTLLSFNPELNIANQRSGVRVDGRDPETGQQIVATACRGSEEAREPGRRSGGDIVANIYGEVEERILDRPVYTQQEAENLVRSESNRRAERLITGRAESIGIPEIRAGEKIELEGLGNKFSRTYNIDRTTHTISNAGYSTNFNIKANKI